MHTNFHTEHGLTTIQRLIHRLHDVLPRNFPTEFILAALREIMTNNIFAFGDTHWLQLSGTAAMGTSCAVTHAVLCVAHHEITKLLTRFKTSLLLHKRFIDNGIDVWLDNGNPAEFAEFKDVLNEFGILRWTASPLSTRVIFLDLE